LAGPVFSMTLKNIQSKEELIQKVEKQENLTLPSFSNSIFSAMLPVFLLAISALLAYFNFGRIAMAQLIGFINEPTVLMLFALCVVTYSLGIAQGKTIAHTMSIYENGIKDVAAILLIIGASGALKQVLIDSNTSALIATYCSNFNLHPLVLGWLIAAIIRVFLGSATVAGLTAAGIIAPMMPTIHTNPNLMILAIGSGSIFFSHINDAGFWLFKEYFKVSIKDTFLSWSLMESIVSVVGLLGVLALSTFL